MSWREQASEQAQSDLDALLNGALGFARQQLEVRGEFFPFAAVVNKEGEVEMIALQSASASDHPRSDDLVARAASELRSRRSSIRAGAIAKDVRLVPDGGDAVEVDLEHREGQAMTIHLPYKRRRFRKGVEVGPLQAQNGRRRVWNAE